MNCATGTVFVVDDAAEVRTSLSRLLNTGGYCVQAFESAESFLQSQNANTHECLLPTPSHERSAHMHRKVHAFRSTGADYALTDVDSA
jgi:DNA-binding NtrC family response regulator